MKNNNSRPVAIVGISSRFAQAKNTNELWSLLINGKDVITKVPKDRWDMEQYYNPDKSIPNKTNQNVGGFLNKIHHFDPQLFNISPLEAYEMSPSQKLVLELAWELIEDSSIPYNKITGSKTGVYLGNIWGDFEHYRKAKNSEINNFSGIGQSANVIANRISFFFGLTGPSFVLDTGCSSSLIAIMECVEAIQQGKIKMGIAGGINHILDPEQYVYLAKFGGLSSKGKCSSFDAGADGFVRAEGAGLILLKSLEEAEKDGDKIVAVIQGGAVNNNGFNTNMPATSINGQLELFELAYKNSGVDPAKVHYIETHGTGTILGDPLEAEAVGRFFSSKIPDNKKIIIGSVKPNLGHTEGAAGIAGFLKVILSMKNNLIPKNINFNAPNPKIKFDEWKIKVPTENERWPVSKNEKYLAGVSSFGWGGSNAHIILEQYQPKVEKDTINFFRKLYYTIPLSAKTESALKTYARLTVSQLRRMKENNLDNLAEYCASFAISKPNLDYRKVIFGENAEQLIHQLTEFTQSEIEIDPSEAKTNSKKVFIFPGQGSQWLSMGKILYDKHQVFKNSILECEDAFNKFIDWSLIKEINASKESSNLNKINVIQPYIFAIQISLAKLWISMGIVPDAIVGHSMGEVAAAHIAGILTLSDAAKIICTRSKLMNTLSGTGGAMAVTELSFEEASDELRQYKGRISVAVINSPKSTVLAGDENDIKDITTKLDNKNLFIKQVKVDVASHSPQMDAIKQQLFNEISTITPLKSKYKLYSTVRRKLVDGADMDASYWIENLRNTVQFEPIMKELLKSKHNLFIEVSPHPVLKTAVMECADYYEYSNISVIGSTHREHNEEMEFMKNFSHIIESGYTVNWNTYFNTNKISHIELPAYPMEKKEYKIKDLSILKNGSQMAQSLHPFLNKKLELAGSRDLYYESTLSINNLPYLAQHKVNNEAVFPGGFFLEMVLFALKQDFPDIKYVIKDLKFLKPIVLVEDSTVQLQLKLIMKEDVPEAFEFYKKTTENGEWQIYCSGVLSNKSKFSIPKESIAEENYILDKTAVYQSFKNLGVDFGPLFQNVTSINGNESSSLTKLKIKADNIPDSNKFIINPIILDNILHPLFTSVFSAFNKKNIISTFVTGIEEIVFLDNCNFTEKLQVQFELEEPLFNKNKTSCLIKGNFYVKNSQSETIIYCKGVGAKAIDTGIEKPTTEVQDSDYLINHIKQLETTEEKVEVIQSHIITTIAKMTKANASKINPGTTFKSLGIDSLTTVQLRNVFEKDFYVPITTKDFSKYLSPKPLSWFIYDMIKLGNDKSTDKRVNDPWIVKSKRKVKITHQIILFHDAGGSSRLFSEWDTYIPKNHELISIELPGRGNRLSELPINEFKQLMDIIVPKLNAIINKPFSIFGHSMGGLLAYETACALQLEHNKTAENLIVTGTPYLYNYNNVLINAIIENKVTDSDLMKLIPGITKDTDKDLANMIVKAFRADFELIYSYPYNNSTLLNSNITVIHAPDDDRVETNDVKKWYKATTKLFTYKEVMGGHSFVYSKNKEVADIVKEAVSISLVGKKSQSKKIKTKL